MPARRAYPFIYHVCTRRLDDDARLEVDAVLGDERAKAVVQQHRRDAIALMDAEIG